MRAAVSALDALCADLGVDPSQPGLQTFEATDMLVRRRCIDPCMHLVVWQVGLIGELGYRRQGYLNSGFSILLDYLEEVYGAGHTVVNYVASRYPGIEPLADSRPLAAFRDPDAQAKVTGISTFYLPPKEAAPADEEMLTRLGLLPPGATVRATTSPLREIDRYGPRELKAFDAFARFRVPAGYHWQEDTAAARFALALREDRDLRERYVRDPAGAVVPGAPRPSTAVNGTCWDAVILVHCRSRPREYPPVTCRRDRSSAPCSPAGPPHVNWSGQCGGGHPAGPANCSPAAPPRTSPRRPDRRLTT